MERVIFVIAFLMVMIGCNNNDKSDDITIVPTENPADSVVDTIATYIKEYNENGFIDGAITKVSSDDRDYKDVYTFFKKEFGLHSMIDYHLLSHNILQDTCYVVNSYEDFRSIYFGEDKLPEVDFDTYTLIVGQHFCDAFRFAVMSEIYPKKQVFSEKEGEYALDIYYTLSKDSIWLNADVYAHFWGMYPKINAKEIKIDIITDNKP